MRPESRSAHAAFALSTVVPSCVSTKLASIQRSSTDVGRCVCALRSRSRSHSTRASVRKPCERLADVPWCLSVDIEEDDLHYRHWFEGIRCSKEPQELHATGAYSVWLRLHPAGRPDETLVVDEVMLAGWRRSQTE